MNQKNMKHIKKFESYGNNEEVSKVNEEFDFTAVSEIFNNFIQWLQQTHATDPEYGVGIVQNWETVVGVLGALGLTSPLWYGMIKFNKEQKEKLNQLIAKKVEENPDKDPKEIAKEVEEEFKGRKF